MLADNPEILAWRSVETYPITRVLYAAVTVALDRHEAGQFAAALGDASAHGPNVELALMACNPVVL